MAGIAYRIIKMNIGSTLLKRISYAGLILAGNDNGYNLSTLVYK